MAIIMEKEIAHFITLMFYLILLVASPIIFVKAVLDRFIPHNIWIILLITSGFTYTIFGMIRNIYTNLTTLLDEHADLVNDSTKWVLVISVHSLFIYILKHKSMSETSMIIISLSLYIISSIKIVCGNADGTHICHWLYHVFLLLAIQHGLRRHIDACMWCGLVAVAGGLVQVSPNVVEMHKKLNGVLRRKVTKLGRWISESKAWLYASTFFTCF